MTDKRGLRAWDEIRRLEAGSEWTKPTVTAHPPPPSIPKPWEEASDE